MGHAVASDETWSRFWGGDTDARSEILAAYFPMVQRLARKMWMHLRRHPEFDDLVQDGAIGLIQALDSYRPDLGTRFSTHAYRRVNGAILDGVRSRDWLPRAVRERYRAVQAAASSFEAEHGRSPSDAELVSLVGETEESLVELRTHLLREMFDSTDRVIGTDRGESLTIASTLADRTFQDEYEMVEWRDAMVRSLIALPDSHATVLRLAFFQERTLKDIAHDRRVTYYRAGRLRDEGLSFLHAGMMGESMQLGARLRTRSTEAEAGMPVPCVGVA